MPTSVCSYAILHIAGADAAAFLHAQLTVDVPRLGTTRHALAAWCDAKGRALCSGRVVPQDDGYLFILPAPLAATISHRLRMYVLRANVSIADVTAQWTVDGLTPDAATLPADGVLSPYNDALVLGVDTGDGPGALVLHRTGNIAEARTAVTDNRWQLAEIDAGLPEIRTATSGLFVPQMLNLHWLGGLDFNKGCYPGQEVVARLQYRGRLKRRLFRLRWHGQQPAAGDDVLDTDDAKQGTVIRAAGCGDGIGRLLAVVRVDRGDQPLTTAGARLQLLDLPYATRDS